MSDVDEQIDQIEGVKFRSTTSYEFCKEIGRGGMGVVFLAQRSCEGVKDDVVLKCLKSVSDGNVDSFINEANVSTTLRHENIVKTYGMEAVPLFKMPKEFRKAVGALSSAKRPISAGGKTGVGLEKLYFIVMDYVDGVDLGQLFTSHLRQRSLLPCELTAFIISRICRALDYAHDYIVHKDISPPNILINRHGVAKLTDFGIAVPVDEASEAFSGKLQYMSPEQIHREKMDVRTDIFSLGLVAYQMLTGLTLYLPAGGTLQESIKSIKTKMAEPILPPHEVRADIPESLSLMIMKMLEKNQEKRYDSMGAVGNDLEMNYLYAKGFGPTNNSLRDYIILFEKGFKEYAQKQLLQLKFLAGDDGKLKIRRRLNPKEYTEKGLQVITSSFDATIKKCLKIN